MRRRACLASLLVAVAAGALLAWTLGLDGGDEVAVALKDAADGPAGGGGAEDGVGLPGEAGTVEGRVLDVEADDLEGDVAGRGIGAEGAVRGA